MQTESRTIEELIEGKECPLPLEVIPNKMGVPVCNVKGIEWTRQEDDQLLSLTILFKPSPAKTDPSKPL